MKLEEAINGLKCGAVNEEYNAVSFNKAWLDKAYETLKQFIEADIGEALKCVDMLKEDGCITTLYQGKALETIRQYILKAQEQEKENTELKQSKSLAERCWEIVKPHLRVGIDYGTDRDVSVAILTFVDGKKTLYVLDQATKEINPEHFVELETLKEGLKECK